MRVVGLVVLGMILGAAIGVGAMLAVHRGTAALPDHVVGIVKRCTTIAGDGKTYERIDDRCANGDTAPPSDNTVINTRLELTVRTSAGTTYTVTTAPSTSVNIGDQWPKP